MAAALRLPEVIGHRGAAAWAPENTLAGIAKAADLGLEWVEFDVKLSGDGHAVLFHDDTLDRTTDGTGPVAATGLTDLRRLDAGAWFDRRFAGERIPLLEEALELCRARGLRVNLEIKPCPGRAADTARVVVERTRQVWGDGPPPLIISFQPDCLRVARDMAPDWPRGLNMLRRPRRWRGLVAELECRTLHCIHRMYNRRSIAEFKAMGFGLVAFTVNDPGKAARLRRRGVDTIVSDNPDVIERELLAA